MKNKVPANLVPPPRRGPDRRTAGAGPHAKGVRRQRSRSAREAAALQEQSSG